MKFPVADITLLIAEELPTAIGCELLLELVNCGAILREMFDPAKDEFGIAKMEEEGEMDDGALEVKDSKSGIIRRELALDSDKLDILALEGEFEERFAWFERALSKTG